MQKQLLGDQVVLQLRYPLNAGVAELCQEWMIDWRSVLMLLSDGEE